MYERPCPAAQAVNMAFFYEKISTANNLAVKKMAFIFALPKGAIAR